MPSSFQLLLNGTVDEALHSDLSLLEVEENADLPGVIQLHLPVNSSEGGDLTYVNNPGLQSYANLAVVVTPEGGDDAYTFGVNRNTERLCVLRPPLRECYGRDEYSVRHGELILILQQVIEENIAIYEIRMG